MLSNSCEYAIRAVLYVAQNKAARIGLRDLATDLDIPLHFLGKIMQNLVRHNILSSAKGPNGGFFLQPDQYDVPLIRIVELIDGVQSFNRCGLGLTKCSDERPCPIHEAVKPYRDTLEKQLQTQTISRLVQGIDKGKTFVMNAPVH